MFAERVVRVELRGVPRLAVLAACGALLIAAAPAGAQQAMAGGRSADWLTAAAVLAAPDALRADAEARAWTEGGELVVVRAGGNGLICIADTRDPELFAAACYHQSLEPFMARGRALRAEGVDGARREEIRWEEIRGGTLPMPAVAMVYNLRADAGEFDPATTDPATVYRLHSLYIPNATVESTGVSAQPGPDPWLMLAGTPSAHVMISLPPRPAP